MLLLSELGAECDFGTVDFWLDGDVICVVYYSYESCRRCHIYLSRLEILLLIVLLFALLFSCS